MADDHLQRVRVEVLDVVVVDGLNGYEGQPLRWPCREGAGVDLPAEEAEVLGAARDQDGLARLLDAHPQGSRDARARIKAYGGQGWDVRWTRNSEFANVWTVNVTGTARAEHKPVRATETIAWEDAHWVMAPLPGVVPTPSNAAGTEPPG